MRSVAKSAHDALMFDLPLTPAARVDLCVDTDDHWRALQSAVRDGATAEELDEVIGQVGEGSVTQRMTSLIERYAPHWSHLTWRSDWDSIPDDDRA